MLTRKSLYASTAQIMGDFPLYQRIQATHKDENETIVKPKHNTFRKIVSQQNLFNLNDYNKQNKNKIKWDDYFDCVYITYTLNELNDMTKQELENVGLLKYIKIIPYTLNIGFKELAFFKKKSIYDCCIDANKNNFNKILILTDDIKFINDVELEKLLESYKTINNICCNKNDIINDCFIFDSNTIKTISKLDINFSTRSWYDVMLSNIKFDNFNGKDLCIHKIDYVFPYVDSSDKEWQKIHDKYTVKDPKEINTPNRYRSWENIKYIFRGIEENMPWINNVYLIVCSETQVPKEINKEKVKIVLHKDFIPEKFLPTFSSSEIETFFGFIPNLSEYFIYGNDDTFTLKKCLPQDFFDKGVSKMKMNPFTVGNDYFSKLCRRSATLGMKEFGLVKNYRPCHMLHPIHKSSFYHIWAMYKKQLEESVTMFRSDKDYNQYVPILHKWAENGCKFNNTLTESYNGLSDTTLPSLITNKILRSKVHMLCLNDCDGLHKKFDTLKKIINGALEKRFPNVSQYENK